MGLLDIILSAVGERSQTAGGSDPLGGALGALLAQNGGLPGLIGKFTQAGHGDAVSSWVGMGDNQPVTAGQVHNALGADQIEALAARLGLDPGQASGFLAEYLPKIVDKLTPTGNVDPNADHQQGLEALLPSLLRSLGGDAGQT